MLPTDEKNREKFAKISAVLISLWQSSRQKLSSATIMPEYTAQCDIFKKNWFKIKRFKPFYNKRPRQRCDAPNPLFCYCFYLPAILDC